jgi:hypothetical protein
MCGSGAQATIPGGGVAHPGKPPQPYSEPSVGIEPLHCSTHGGARAAWACDDCQRRLCPECAEALEVGRGVTVVGCLPCGGPAQPLMVPGAEQSFTASLRNVLAVPVGVGGLAVLVGLAYLAGRMVAGGAPPVWILCGWSVPAAFVAVIVVRATAEWSGPAAPRVRVPFGPGLSERGLLLAVLAVPLLVGAARADLAGRLALALGAGAFAPLGLAGVACGPSPLRTFDLRWYGQAARAVGGDGLLASALSAALLCFAAWLWSAATEGSADEAPALWRVAAGMVAALSVLLLPRLAGLLVRAHAEGLEVELQTRGRRPAWPEARPRRRRTLAPDGGAS